MTDPPLGAKNDEVMYSIARLAAERKRSLLRLACGNVITRDHGVQVRADLYIRILLAIADKSAEAAGSHGGFLSVRRYKKTKQWLLRFIRYSD